MIDPNLQSTLRTLGLTEADVAHTEPDGVVLRLDVLAREAPRAHASSVAVARLRGPVADPRAIASRLHRQGQRVVAIADGGPPVPEPWWPAVGLAIDGRDLTSRVAAEPAGAGLDVTPWTRPWLEVGSDGLPILRHGEPPDPERPTWGSAIAERIAHRCADIAVLSVASGATGLASCVEVRARRIGIGPRAVVFDVTDEAPTAPAVARAMRALAIAELFDVPSIVATDPATCEAWRAAVAGHGAAVVVPRDSTDFVAAVGAALLEPVGLRYLAALGESLAVRLDRFARLVLGRPSVVGVVEPAGGVGANAAWPVFVAGAEAAVAREGPLRIRALVPVVAAGCLIAHVDGD